MKNHLKRRDFLKTVGIGATALAVPGLMNACRRAIDESKELPNIIFILADDMGYGD